LSSICALCAAQAPVQNFAVSKAPQGIPNELSLCHTCIDQIQSEQLDPNHFRCLNDSIWSEQAPVQVLSWRLLHRFLPEAWAQNLLDMMYLDEEHLAWAQAELDAQASALVHVDANGVVLQAGDNVVLIKDLKVKGSSMVAKQGTAVRRIALDPENATYIEGKVDGQQIVILTQYVKKTT
jgi:protein PhnA